MNILEVNNLNKSFGGLKAVSDVSFAVKKGSIKGVIGPNGAGKTTLFNLIAGSLKPETGSILFNGKPIQRLLPHKTAAQGISRTFQNIKLFKHMTVLENVMVGGHLASRANMVAGMLNLPFTWKEESSVRRRAMELLDLMDITSLAFEDASRLSFGQQRSVEFARALASKPSLLLLDEPAAGLNMKETSAAGALIRRIRDMGVTILIVEHDMSLVMNISDEILVLCFGKAIADGKPVDIRKNPEVIRVYLGEDDAQD